MPAAHSDNTRRILGQWYADPLSAETARACLARATQRRQTRFRRGASCISCELAEMIARFWLGESVDDRYQRLSHRCRTSHRGKALVELVYGQLLISRRLDGAWLHLDTGFEEARLLFAPADYFMVLQRHQQLRHLPLGTEPLQPEPLSHLLTSARVIEQLEKSAGIKTPRQGTHRDTFD